MKKIFSLQTALLCAAMLLITVSCKKDYGNLNSPTVESFLSNATPSQLNNLVSGTESGMRNSLAFYLDDVSTIGRECYHFSGTEPRYVTDLLGASSNQLTSSNFYITNPWASRYRVVKNCNLLIQAAANSTFIDNAQKKAYSGFAKTIKAYQLLLNVNLTYKNGIRINVDDADNLGPIVSYDDALTAIAALLDAGKTDLTGSTVSFQLSAGFNGFTDAAGLVKFNRAIAARVAVYRQKWSDAATALTESFLDLNGNFSTGVSHAYSAGSGDQLNAMFIPQNQNGETRVAHPSYATDITTGDDRIGKATLRNSTASLSGLSSNRDVWVYTSSTAMLPIIRNEELILLYAEVKIAAGGTTNLADAVTALNKIRTGHGLSAYAGANTQTALATELLYERRYSLFMEGHRWIDMRRAGLLNLLPKDRTDDDVWEQFPLPVSEG